LGYGGDHAQAGGRLRGVGAEEAEMKPEAFRHGEGFQDSERLKSWICHELCSCRRKTFMATDGLGFTRIRKRLGFICVNPCPSVARPVLRSWALPARCPRHENLTKSGFRCTVTKDAAFLQSRPPIVPAFSRAILVSLTKFIIPTQPKL